jgi:argininosuccinate synthase
MNTRVVAAYGGSVETAAAIAALAARLGAELVTVTVDVGQPVDLELARDRALSAGAARAHVVDARGELATRVLAPALMAGAFGSGPLGTSVSRPVIAAHLVAVARMEGATAVAHGATGPDRRRIESLIADLAPELAVHAVGTAQPSNVAIEENLWARSVLRPADAEPEAGPRVRTFTRTHSPDACSPDPAVVEISFERGVPVAVNGVSLAVPELIEVVDTIGGDHGVGRFEAVEDGTRRVEESPASVVLAAATTELVASGLADDQRALWAASADAYRAVILDGRWHSDARAELDAFVRATVGELSGVVRLLLLGGECRVAALETGRV